MITKQELEGTFTLRPLFVKWMVVFKSLLECFSIGGQTFIQNTSSSTAVLVCWSPFLTIFEFSSLKVLGNALAYAF